MPANHNGRPTQLDKEINEIQTAFYELQIWIRRQRLHPDDADTLCELARQRCETEVKLAKKRRERR